jgi:hypothetical protein
MADRYWVGGTASWDLTAGTKWALTSGGAGGQAVPTAADDVFFNAASGAVTVTVTGFRNAKSVNCTGFTGTLTGTTSVGITISGSLTLVPGMGFTGEMQLFFRALGTITSAGKTLGNVTLENSGSTNVTLNDALTTGALRIFTITAGALNLNNFTLTCGRFESNNSNVRSIAFGTGSIALISTAVGATVLSMNQATNYTCTGTPLFTRSMVNTATFAHGSTGGATSANSPSINITGGSSTVTLSGLSSFRNVNFTGNSSVVNATSMQLRGNLTFSATGTYTGFSTTVIETSTITTNGRTFSALDINASGASATLAGALTLNGRLFLGQGTFTTAGFNVTTGSFLSTSGLTRSVNMGATAWVITANSWEATSTGMTFNAGTSSIRFNSSGTSKSFLGGGLTYYNLIHDSAGAGGLNTLTITGANTFNDITTNVRPSTFVFPAGVTQTLANFTLSGTAGNLVTIQSSVSGTQFTLSKSSGAVNVDYMSIKDSNATGGAVFTANNSVNGGNNTGWLGFPVLDTGNMFMMFLP